MEGGASSGEDTNARERFLDAIVERLNDSVGEVREATLEQAQEVLTRPQAHERRGNVWVDVNAALAAQAVAALEQQAGVQQEVQQ